MAGRDQRSPEAEAYRPLYKTARWQKTRARQLAAQPLCERHLARGSVVVATVCHHKDKEAKKDPSRFFDGPFASSCKPCHDSDEQTEERGGKARPVIGADGWPVSYDD